MSDIRRESGGMPPQSSEMRMAKSAAMEVERLKKQVSQELAKMQADITALTTQVRKLRQQVALGLPETAVETAAVATADDAEDGGEAEQQPQPAKPRAVKKKARKKAARDW